MYATAYLYLREGAKLNETLLERPRKTMPTVGRIISAQAL